MPESERRYVQRRLGALQRERTSWEDEWRELARYISPKSARFFTTDTNRGEKLGEDILNTTPTLALRVLAAGMRSGMSSPSRPWFTFTTRDPKLDESDRVREYTWTVKQRMHEVLGVGNVYGSLHKMYHGLSLSGAAAWTKLADRQDVIRCFVHPLGTWYAANGPRGDVDTLYHEAEWTVAKAVSTFGLDACSDGVKASWRRQSYDMPVTIAHAVEPNRSRDDRITNIRNMPWRSLWWETGANQDQMLLVSGYRRRPFDVPRWDVEGVDTYGRGPAHDARGDIRSLMSYELELARQVELVSDPPTQGPSNYSQEFKGFLPGSFTGLSVSDMSKQGIRPIYDTNPRINELLAVIDRLEHRIKRAFYEDLFLLLQSLDRAQITATEVMERRGEKLTALGPVLENLQNELLVPLVDWLFEEMQDVGLLPDPPEELAGINMAPDFQGLLTREQRIDILLAVERVLGLAGNMAAVKPDIVDKLDFDQTLDEYIDLSGAPPTMVTGDDEVREIREQRAQQMQQAQAMEQVSQGADVAQRGAQAAKVLSETGGNVQQLLQLAASQGTGVPGR